MNLLIIQVYLGLVSKVILRILLRGLQIAGDFEKGITFPVYIWLGEVFLIIRSIPGYGKCFS